MMSITTGIRPYSTTHWIWWGCPAVMLEVVQAASCEEKGIERKYTWWLLSTSRVASFPDHSQNFILQLWKTEFSPQLWDKKSGGNEATFIKSLLPKSVNSYMVSKCPSEQYDAGNQQRICLVSTGKWKMLKCGNQSTEKEVRKPKYGSEKKSFLSVFSALLSHEYVCWGLVAKSTCDVRAGSWS